MRTKEKVCALGVAGALAVATSPLALAGPAAATTVSEQEPNGTTAEATVVSIGDTVEGTFTSNETAGQYEPDDVDVYQIKVGKTCKLTISFVNDAALPTSFMLTDFESARGTDFEPLKSAFTSKKGQLSDTSSASETYVVPKGTYYFTLEYFAVLNSDPLPYHLTIASSGSGVSLKSLKAGKKAFTAKWGKQSDVAGYQIRYTPSKTYKKSKWKKAKTKDVSAKKASVKVKKLKAKTKYKVQVRAVYEGDEDLGIDDMYTAWSSAKTVKTK